MWYNNRLYQTLFIACITLFKLYDKVRIARFSMHVLRYIYSTRAIEGGIRLKILQVIPGHFNVGIIMNFYVHVTEVEGC